MSLRDEVNKSLGIKGRSRHKAGGSTRQNHYVGEAVVNKVKGAYKGVKGGINAVKTGFGNAKQLYRDSKDLIGQAKQGISEGKKFYNENAGQIKEKAKEAIGSAKKLVGKKHGGRTSRATGGQPSADLKAMSDWGDRDARSAYTKMTGKKYASYRSGTPLKTGGSTRQKHGWGDIAKVGSMFQKHSIGGDVLNKAKGALNSAKEYAEPRVKKAISESGKALKSGADMASSGINRGISEGKNALKGKKILGHQFKTGGMVDSHGMASQCKRPKRTVQIPGRENHFLGALAGPAMQVAKLAAPTVIGWATGKLLNRMSKKKEDTPKSSPSTYKKPAMAKTAKVSPQMAFRGGKIKEVRLATKLESPERKNHGGRTCHAAGGAGKDRKGQY